MVVGIGKVTYDRGMIGMIGVNKTNLLNIGTVSGCGLLRKYR